jgi:hypothetical protein
LDGTSNRKQATNDKRPAHPFILQLFLEISRQRADKRESQISRYAATGREILDQVIALNKEHLRRLLRDSVNHHQQDRLHDALEKDTPNRRAVQPRPGTNATVIALPRLSGLHHRYAWR